MTQPAELSESWCTLSTDQRKALYGMSYVRSICSQAGVTITATEQDSDVLAIDCNVEFEELSVRVQVKCTSQWVLRGHSLSYPVKEGWIRKWQKCMGPVYFVVVIVPPDSMQWIAHDHEGTMHKTGAFWTRLKPGAIGGSVQVPKSQRLTAQAIEEWHCDLINRASPEETGGGNV
jgi:hypothetical protein